MAEVLQEVEVADVGISPVKSMGFLHGVEALCFDEEGLFGDREFMLVEAETGKFISQRQDPILTQFEIGQRDDGVVFLKYRALGKESEYYLHTIEETDENTMDVAVHTWRGKGVDQGDGAAHWASEILGRDVKIVRRSENHPRFVNNNPDIGKVGFADGYQLLVASQASVDRVNDWLDEADEEPVSASQFRAGLLLGQGIEAFGEDTIGSLKLCVGGLELVLERTKACDRCIIIDTDQDTGERKMVDGRLATPLMKVLKANGRSGRNVGNGDKRGTFFGQNFRIVMPEDMEPGTTINLQTGATLQAAITEFPNWVPLDRK